MILKGGKSFKLKSDEKDSTLTFSPKILGNSVRDVGARREDPDADFTKIKRFIPKEKNRKHG